MSSPSSSNDDDGNIIPERRTDNPNDTDTREQVKSKCSIAPMDLHEAKQNKQRKHNDHTLKES